MGGSEAIVDALVRGLEKHGGRLLLRSHVEQILVEGGRAAGVVLRGGGSGSSAGDDDEAAGAAQSSSETTSSTTATTTEPRVIRARRGVISNASVWDTLKLLPQSSVPAEWRRERQATPETGSFVHLHLGIDATGLPEDLDCHHL